MKLRALLLFCLALAAAGCGSSKQANSTTTLAHVLPNAATPDEWAQRIVGIFLRPLNKDLQVLNGFNSPDIRLYIASQNPTTLKILHTRLNDLERCSGKLVQIGPPPGRPVALARVYKDFQVACSHYEPVAKKLMQATEFLTSGRTDVISRGLDVARSARPESGFAANSLVAGVRIAQTLPAFQRAGLKPSV